MTTPHFPDDWEILSAYLDGQLSSREMDKVRQRLETQPELQRALDELQRTRMVLRAAPRRRAPRNFTLSPDVVPQRKSWFGWTPVFGFASALAVVVLVATFAFTLLPGFNSTAQMLAAAPSSPQATNGAAAAAPQASDQSNAQPPIIAWGGGASGLGGGPASAPPGAGGGGGEPGASIEAAPTQEPNATPLVPPVAQPQPAIIASASPDTLQATAEPPLRNAVPSLGSGPILGIRPTDEQGKIEITPESGQSLAYAALNPTASGESPTFLQRNLGAIQIGLGLLAVGFALAAILLRRRS